MADEFDTMIGAAVAGTEKEIFSESMDQEDPELDASGDRAQEDMGDGLEGQPEPEEAEEGEEGEAAEEAEAKTEDAAQPPDPEGKLAAKDEAQPEPSKRRVPLSELMAEREKTRAANTERDAVKAQMEASQREFQALSSKLDQALGRIDQISRAAQPAATAQPAARPEDKEPDIFAQPDEWRAWNERRTHALVTGAVQSVTRQFSDRFVEMSLQSAAERDAERFNAAMGAIKQMPTNDPGAQQLVRSIWGAPDPGRALINWWGQQQTLREVGTDPLAYRDRVAKETREALMKDPEFRKQLVADLQAEARNGTGAKPIVRGTRSLTDAGGQSANALERARVNGSGVPSQVTWAQTDAEAFHDALRD